MTRIFVRTPSRIAMSLLDMNGGLGRVDGGPGFSLREPHLEFLIENTEEIIFENACALSDELGRAVVCNLMELKKEKDYGGVKVTVVKSIPEHSGFGSKTATLLSIGRAYGLLNGVELSYRELAIIARRGGTSGIGVNIIDRGGFIVEGGHSTEYKREFAPSSATKVVMPAPLLARYTMPEWDIMVAMPKLERVFGKKEGSFFKRVCPIPKRDVEELSRIILVQLMPAVIENNVDIFCQGVNRIQELAWKKNEIELYGEKIKSIMNCGKKNGALCAGMSSIGPAVYFLGGNLAKAEGELKKRFDMSELDLFFTKPDNKGVEYKVEK